MNFSSAARFRRGLHRALLLAARHALVLERHAGVFAPLVWRGALARFLRGVAGGHAGALGGGAELVDQLLDEEALVHAADGRAAVRSGKKKASGAENGGCPSSRCAKFPVSP
ncbi:MAG: hypothetical protein QM765_42740 [Myxococcales bacterium]